STSVATGIARLKTASLGWLRLRSLNPISAFLWKPKETASLSKSPARGRRGQVLHLLTIPFVTEGSDFAQSTAWRCSSQSFSSSRMFYEDTSQHRGGKGQGIGGGRTISSLAPLTLCVQKAIK